jgi:hypothetical protein
VTSPARLLFCPPLMPLPRMSPASILSRTTRPNPNRPRNLQGLLPCATNIPNVLQAYVLTRDVEATVTKVKFVQKKPAEQPKKAEPKKTADPKKKFQPKATATAVRKAHTNKATASAARRTSTRLRAALQSMVLSDNSDYQATMLTVISAEADNAAYSGIFGEQARVDFQGIQSYGHPRLPLDPEQTEPNC